MVAYVGVVRLGGAAIRAGWFYIPNHVVVLFETRRRICSSCGYPLSTVGDIVDQNVLPQPVRGAVESPALIDAG